MDRHPYGTHLPPFHYVVSIKGMNVRNNGIIKQNKQTFQNDSHDRHKNRRVSKQHR